MGCRLNSIHRLLHARRLLFLVSRGQLYVLVFARSGHAVVERRGRIVEPAIPDAWIRTSRVVSRVARVEIASASHASSRVVATAPSRAAGEEVAPALHDGPARIVACSTADIAAAPGE